MSGIKRPLKALLPPASQARRSWWRTEPWQPNPLAMAPIELIRYHDKEGKHLGPAPRKGCHAKGVLDQHQRGLPGLDHYAW
jgi:hypothetical protein